MGGCIELECEVKRCDENKEEVLGVGARRNPTQSTGLATRFPT